LQDFLKISKPKTTLHIATSHAEDQTVFVDKVLLLTQMLCMCAHHARKCYTGS